MIEIKATLLIATARDRGDQFRAFPPTRPDQTLTRPDLILRV